MSNKGPNKDKGKGEIDKVHQPRDMDISAAGRGVWLVKVPKYLSEKWKSYPSGKDVGKLRITKSKVPNKKPDIIFTSYEGTANPKTEVKPGMPQSISNKPGMPQSIYPINAPNKVSLLSAPYAAAGSSSSSSSSTTNAPVTRNHKFILTGVGTQNLVVMAQNAVENGDALDYKMSVEGKVRQRAECHPIVDDSYRTFKKQLVKEQTTPKRTMQLLTGVVNTYKPISDHVFNREEKNAKRNEVKKTRADKDKVMDILFDAFEKHQFYNVRDLVGITKQPVPYLKEILKEICNYNMTAPHKNMWELKPEFRHYKQHEGDTGGDV